MSYEPSHLVQNITAWEKAVPARCRLKTQKIVLIVAAHYGVEHLDMISIRRDRPYPRYRQIAMYLAHELTGRSLPEIGRAFGGRSHTTVLHSVRKIKALIQADEALRDEIAALSEKCWRSREAA